MKIKKNYENQREMHMFSNNRKTGKMEKWNQRWFRRGGKHGSGKGPGSDFRLHVYGKGNGKGKGIIQKGTLTKGKGAQYWEAGLPSPLPKTILFHCIPPLPGGFAIQFKGKTRRS